MSYIRLLLLIIVLVGCDNKKAKDGETILKGKTSIIVDESLLPIIQDQIMVFEGDYDAKITATPRSEKEAIRAFSSDTAKIVILARDLTAQELKLFNQKAINPVRTKFATDAIVFIANKQSRDSVIVLQDVFEFMRGNSSQLKGLVFDNPNSSTVRYLMQLAGIESMRDDNIFSFRTNKEAIDFISQNNGMIGVVGLNWVLESKEASQSDIRVLAVKSDESSEAITPTQSNIALGKYPLARDLFIINAQGYAGLGMGFGSFITGDRGQRIILKSGLLPVRLPSRNILVRDQIQKK